VVAVGSNGFIVTACPTDEKKAQKLIKQRSGKSGQSGGKQGQPNTGKSGGSQQRQN
jgi:hypothetical protein